jgi:capsular polysaccharide biosynthesis protein
MEFKDYIKIFVKNLVWFSIVILLALAIGAGYKQYKNSRTTSYQSYLLLNVTRSGIQTTDAYRYDDFYRLQADEKFADTVVAWLKTPRVATNVLNETGITSGEINLKNLAKLFKAKRLTSQSIEVVYSSRSAGGAQDTSVAIVREINQEAKELNQSQKEDSWFKVIGDEPVIKEYKVNWIDVLPISIILGIFLGIWVVLIKNYLTKE